jgi:uncharacterized membrane protein YdjX (TVP38/TMEM64 family)
MNVQAAGLVDPGQLSAIATFVGVTVWCHGPLSPILPVAYEPVLLAAGQHYAAFPLALVGAVASTGAEWINYLLYGPLVRARLCNRLLKTKGAERLKAWFERWPFLTVWLGILTPAPDWAVRLLAVQSRYSLPRYLLAVLVARIPRFWFLAAVGAVLRPSLLLLGLVVVGSVVVVVGVRYRRGRSRARHREEQWPSGAASVDAATARVHVAV